MKRTISNPRQDQATWPQREQHKLPKHWSSTSGLLNSGALKIHVYMCARVCTHSLIPDPTLEDPGSLAMARAGPQNKLLLKWPMRFCRWARYGKHYSNPCFRFPASGGQANKQHLSFSLTPAVTRRHTSSSRGLLQMRSPDFRIRGVLRCLFSPRAIQLYKDCFLHFCCTGRNRGMMCNIFLCGKQLTLRNTEN